MGEWKTPISTGCALVVLLVLSACSSGGEGDDGLTSGVDQWNQDVDGWSWVDEVVSPPPDRFEAAGLSVDEAEIGIVFQGKDTETTAGLTLVVRRAGALGAVDAFASAELDCGSYGVVPSPVQFSSVPVHLDEEDQDVVVLLGPESCPMEPGNDDAGHLGSCVIHWQVAVGDVALAGRRSGWQALQHLEVNLSAPQVVAPGQDSHARIRVTDFDSGEPLEGVVASLLDQTWLSGNETYWTCTTDETGTCSGIFPGETGYLTACARQGHLVTDAWLSLQTMKSGEPRVLLTTDKPLYQPGQTMHMRTMALVTPGNKPVQETQAEFVVVDSKGNKLARIKEKTNDFGIASATFKLGSHLNLGPYTVVAEVAGAQAARTVKVSRYTLPKFKIETSLKKGFYMAGQTIEGAVHAYYLFGKPVAGGTVEMTSFAADGETSGPFSVSGKTDQDGYFDFSAKLPADIDDYLDGGDGLLLLAVKVTDSADQEQESTLPVPLTTAPIRIFLVPEGEPLVEGFEHRYYLVTTDPSGKMIKTSTTVEFDGQEPLELETDAQGMAVVVGQSSFPAAKIAVTADDGEHQAQALFQFPVKPEGSTIIVRTNKAVYQAGDVMEITVFSAPEKAAVLLDVVREGQIAAMDAAVADGLPVSFKVPVASGWDGEVLVTVTALPDGTAPVQAHRTAFVHRTKELSIAVTTDKDLYAPADTLNLQFEVADEAGTPLQAAIGLTIVDEALFAIQDVKPGLLWHFFEAGNHLAEPTWKHDFPKLDIISLLGQALPDPGSALEHFQFLAAAALAAVESLEVATATASGGAHQQTVAVNTSKWLVKKQMYEIEELAQTNWSAEDWPADGVAARLMATRFIDPWGNPYTTDGDYDWVRFDSAGMDEKWGTDDDVSGSIDLCWLFDDCWEDWEVSYCDVASAGDVGSGGPPGWEDTTQSGDPPSGGEPVKVRRWFPETLYVNPAVITDPQGKASLEIPLADSITQWRVTGLANAQSGRLGTAIHGISVFQDFFVDPDLPVSYTRNDEVTFPVAVYNYLDQEQVVTVYLQPEPWYTPLGPTQESITMPANTVDAVHFSIRVVKAGWHSLTVEAFGPEAADAIARKVEVEPGGRPATVNQSGSTQTESQGSLVLPGDTIEGSARAVLKLYGTGMVQVLEGVDSLLHYPDG